MKKRTEEILDKILTASVKKRCQPEKLKKEILEIFDELDRDKELTIDELELIKEGCQTMLQDSIQSLSIIIAFLSACMGIVSAVISIIGFAKGELEYRVVVSVLTVLSVLSVLGVSVIMFSAVTIYRSSKVNKDNQVLRNNIIAVNLLIYEKQNKGSDLDAKADEKNNENMLLESGRIFWKKKFIKKAVKKK